MVELVTLGFGMGQGTDNTGGGGGTGGGSGGGVGGSGEGTGSGAGSGIIGSGFTPQHIEADFLTKELLQQLGAAWWIGLERIRNQRDQSPNLDSATANIHNSAGTKVLGPVNLAIMPDATIPLLQQVGFLLQSGAGLAIPSADTYRVVYTLMNATGEIYVTQQTFVVRAAPF